MTERLSSSSPIPIATKSLLSHLHCYNSLSPSFHSCLPTVCSSPSGQRGRGSFPSLPILSFLYFPILSWIRFFFFFSTKPLYGTEEGWCLCVCREFLWSRMKSGPERRVSIYKDCLTWGVRTQRDDKVSKEEAYQSLWKMNKVSKWYREQLHIETSYQMATSYQKTDLGGRGGCPWGGIDLHNRYMSCYGVSESK